MNLLWQVFFERFGAAFLIPFANPVTYGAASGFGEASLSLTIADAAGLFIACMMNIALGMGVRHASRGKITLPHWRVFRWVAQYQGYIWPGIALLSFLPLFPQLLFFAGMGMRTPWRLMIFVAIGCGIAGAMQTI